MKFKKTIIGTLIVGSAGLGYYKYDQSLYSDGICFPRNKSKISMNMAGVTGISQDTFNLIISKVEEIYAPIIRKDDITLQVNRLWQDGTVNANANLQGGNLVVNMYGGLARHASVTPAGFALVLCHEIGHYLGKAPTYTQQGGEWAATEGQADYFATAKCMPRVYTSLKDTINFEEAAGEACADKFTPGDKRTFCIAGASGGMSLAQLSWNLGGGSGAQPSVGTPDRTIVDRTYESHPQAQCRLDTYYSGAICEKDANEPFDASNPELGGACTVTQKYTRGLRPLCWYKPPGQGPTGQIAPAPVFTKKDVSISEQVTILFDVTGISGAEATYIEVSKPGMHLIPKNSNLRDTNDLGGVLLKELKGSFTFTTSGELKKVPGVYEFRVIAVNAAGNEARGFFSDVAILNVGQGPACN